MVYVPLDSPSFLLHVLGLVLTIAVSAVVAWWVARQSDDAATRTMVLLLAVHGMMATLFLLQLLVTSLALKTALARVWYGLILSVPVVWFCFAVLYTGRDHWLTKPVVALLAVSALVPFSLSITNSYHRLLVREWMFRTEPFHHYQAVFSDLNNPFFLLVSGYSLAGFALLFRLALFSRRSSRWQSVGLLGGMLAIQIPAVLSVTQYVPITNFPYGIYGAGVFGVIVAVSLFHTRMFAVAPLARDALFEALDDALVVVDTDRRLVDYNDRALAIFPTLDGGVGRPLDDVCPQLVGSSDASPASVPESPDRDPAAQAPTEAESAFGAVASPADDDSGPATGTGPPETDDPATDTETPFADTVQRTIDGATYSFNVTTSEIARRGNTSGYGLVVSDITDLVAYATELERKTERLEQFASVLSHDLRNPVSIAMGRIAIEREDGDTEHLQKASGALDRIEATIDDLLTLARSGETVTDPEQLSLATLVEDAWETSDTGEATVAVDLPGDVRILADRSRLRSLLENLFRNAADHGASHVTVGRLDTGFFVADDGPGIPPDQRETVFEYGFSTADEGTGFGLAIVQSVADAHDWSLDVTESESGGARFEVTGVRTAESGSREPGEAGPEWPSGSSNA